MPRMYKTDVLLDASTNLLRDAVDLIADSAPMHSHAPDMVTLWEAHKTVLLNAISNLELELQDYHNWRNNR